MMQIGMFGGDATTAKVLPARNAVPIMPTVNARIAALIEFVEDVRQRVLVHTAAAVGDRDRHAGLVCGLRQCDFAAVVGEFDRIGEQVVPDDLKHPLVGADHQAVAHFHPKRADDLIQLNVVLYDEDFYHSENLLFQTFHTDYTG